MTWLEEEEEEEEEEEGLFKANAEVVLKGCCVRRCICCIYRIRRCICCIYHSLLLLCSKPTRRGAGEVGSGLGGLVGGIRYRKRKRRLRRRRRKRKGKRVCLAAPNACRCPVAHTHSLATPEGHAKASTTRRRKRRWWRGRGGEGGG